MNTPLSPLGPKSPELVSTRTLSSFKAILLGGVVIGFLGWIVPLTAFLLSLALFATAEGSLSELLVSMSVTWLWAVLALVFALATFCGGLVAALYRDEDQILHSLASGALGWLCYAGFMYSRALDHAGGLILVFVFLSLPLSALGGLLGKARRITNP